MTPLATHRFENKFWLQKQTEDFLPPGGGTKSFFLKTSKIWSKIENP